MELLRSNSRFFYNPAFSWHCVCSGFASGGLRVRRVTSQAGYESGGLRASWVSYEVGELEAGLWGLNWLHGPAPIVYNLLKIKKTMESSQ